MRMKSTLASGILMLVAMFVTGCATSQQGTRGRTLPPSAVEKPSAITQLTVWSKGTVVIPGSPNPWIAVSGGTFSQYTIIKGDVCCELRVEAKGIPEWTVDDPSVLELTPPKAATVTIRPLKEGQYVITVSAEGATTKLSGRVFDKGSTFVVTMSGD